MPTHIRHLPWGPWLSAPSSTCSGACISDSSVLLAGQVIACAKNSDMIMMVLDASKHESDNHRTILTRCVPQRTREHMLHVQRWRLPVHYRCPHAAHPQPTEAAVRPARPAAEG